MVDQEQRKAIMQGVKAWNEWREKNPNAMPELHGLYLRRAKLQSANLSAANLQASNLEDASLEDANLQGANLKWSNIIKANLGGADLQGADFAGSLLGGARFIGAALEGANLEGANLRGTNLVRAHLEGVNLRNAVIEETIFSDVDLSKTEGLSSCKHGRPSYVDHRTLEKSRDVPREFWRGCGLSDWQIEAAKLFHPGLTQSDVYDIGYELLRLRTNQPIQLFSPFISYSSNDEAFAKRLYADLQDQGVRCWYAPEDMKIGDKIRPRIDEVIHLHDKLLLVLSKHSLDSQWVEQEVETALAKERGTGETVLFPIKIDDTIDKIQTGWPAYVRNTRHIGDFTQSDDESYRMSFGRVIRDLRAMP